MKELKIFEIFVFICILIQIVKSLPINKWHKRGDYSNLFIETDRKYNWYEAWNECALKNMTLIAVDTAERNSALTDIMLKNFGTTLNIWIGGHDNGENDKFVWSSTGKRFEFTNWSKGNPDHSRNMEHCVHYLKGTDFEWNDNDCNEKMGFICEENRFLTATRSDFQIKKFFIEQLFSL